MAKRTKMPTDLNQRAKAIVDLASGETEIGEETDSVRHGREGGQVGGRERAERLTPAHRRNPGQGGPGSPRRT